MRRRSLALCLVLLAGPSAGCIHTFSRIEAEPIRTRPAPAMPVAADSARAAPPVTFTTPVRAYLVDGSVVLFRNGARLETQRLTGVAEGVRASGSPFVTIAVPLDSLVGAETYVQRANDADGALVSLMSTALVVAGLALLAPVLFGSCPTVYDGQSGQVVEAELFSNAIAPLLEHRDVDRLGTVRATADGRVVLDVRNEALETHHVNHLELLAAAHAPGETVLQTADDRFVRLRNVRPVLAATTRDGDDAAARLAAPDGHALRTADARLRATTPGDLTDHVDLTLGTDGRDTVALVLRLRSSLLSTRMLYDEMLAGQGAQALDWMGRDLQRFDRVIELTTFVQQRFGLRVLVRPSGTDAPFREAGRVSDGAPSAWQDAAVVLPTGGAARLDVRLESTADAVHLDYAALADVAGFVRPRRIPLARLDVGGRADESARQRVADSDTSYVQTFPGQRLGLTFDVRRAGTASGADTPETYFLAGQGFYTEWMRPGWLATPRPAPFRTTDSTLVRVMHRWAADRDAYAVRFDASRVPVR